MRALLALTLCVLVAGCFSPKYQNGDLRCVPSDAHPCPTGYHCASNNTCWQNGSEPAPGGGDMGMVSDTGDMASSPTGPDMAQPPALTYPPAAVWTSCGGGPVVATTSANELNVSLCGSIVNGTATGSNNATLTFGYFSNDIY
jgi:hypothetical protein